MLVELAQQVEATHPTAAGEGCWVDNSARDRRRCGKILRGWWACLLGARTRSRCVAAAAEALALRESMDEMRSGCLSRIRPCRSLADGSALARVSLGGLALVGSRRRQAAEVPGAVGDA